MNNQYEGLFIFPENLNEEELDKSIENVQKEISELGGKIEKSTRLGKKYFTRILNKNKSGYYIVLVFNINPNKIDSFKARLKLGTNVFRSQFTKIEDKNNLAEEVS